MRRVPILNLLKSWRPMTSPTALVMIAGVVLPMIVLAVVSLSAPRDFGGVSWGDFTAGAYERILFDRDWDGGASFSRVISPFSSGR